MKGKCGLLFFSNLKEVFIDLDLFKQISLTFGGGNYYFRFLLLVFLGRRVRVCVRGSFLIGGVVLKYSVVVANIGRFT